MNQVRTLPSKNSPQTRRPVRMPGAQMLKKTKQPRAEKTREALLRAAIDVVRKAGYENTRIQDVSDRVGVTPGAILYHFRNLETLLMEAFRVDFDELMHVVVRPESLKGVSAEEIVSMTLAMLDDKTFRKRIGVLTEFLIAARNDTKRRKLVEDVMRENRQRLVVAFTQGIGDEIDGARLWQIIDVAISLLIADQLNYPSATTSDEAFKSARPFLEQELRRFLNETRPAVQSN